MKSLIVARRHRLCHVAHVATSSISEIHQSQKETTVGAVSIVINKMTGDFGRFRQSPDSREPSG
jgi:hypothetical protein